MLTAHDDAKDSSMGIFSDLPVGPQVVEISDVVARRYLESTDEVMAIPVAADGELDAMTGRPSSGPRVATNTRGPSESSRERQWVYRRTSDLPRERFTTWPNCPALRIQLDELRQQPVAADWCAQVLSELASVRQLDTLTTVAAGDVLDRLHDLAQQGWVRSGMIHDSVTRNQWGRAAHALERRLAIWRRIHQTAGNGTSPVAMTIRDTLNLTAVLDAVDDRLQGVKTGQAWRNYLRVEQARTLTDPADTTAARQLAREILERMDYSRLNPEQRDFLLDPRLLAYAQELKHLAAEPVDYSKLLNDLEDFELRAHYDTVARIAAAHRALRWSHDETVMRLGQELDGRYRNANVRLAVSSQLMNRWMPPSEPAELPIDERIMGIRTRGSSATVAELRVELLPSPDSWNFYLHADGQVASRTYASQGPATFFTRGRSVFQAEKQIVIRPEGIRQLNAEVAANSSTNLSGLRTDVDRIPLLGNLAQAIATHQYQARVPRAEWEARNRLAWRVGETIDHQVREQLEQVEQRFTNHFQRPMQKLGVDPLPVELQTTEQRVIARYRLAGPHQLAAYTPRPLAPANSLMSMQIHESALNNVVDQLGWSGRRVPLAEIYQELGALFAAPTIQAPDDLPDDVVVRFADRNPIRLLFQDGRVTVTLGLAELSQGRNRWRNFVVRVHYQPALDDPDVDLVRDQFVELIGRLSLRDQIALRGVFSRVFNRERPFDLFSRRLADEPQMAGLEVSQMDIEDGWFALAIGPSGTRTAMEARDRRYRTPGSLLR
ncbi:MAG: hypothetical protein EA424_20120 [Planctomycetaceae bacterium]|nr:MAG: hypothetical protein EA424_20120 [Planctomycetaceae bacterium]